MLEVVKSPWIISSSWISAIYSPILYDNSFLFSSVTSSIMSLTILPSIFDIVMDLSTRSMSYRIGVIIPEAFACDNIFASDFVLSFLILLSISGILYAFGSLFLTTTSIGSNPSKPSNHCDFTMSDSAPFASKLSGKLILLLMSFTHGTSTSSVLYLWMTLVSPILMVP